MILILILTILSSANGSNPNCDSNLCEHCWKHSPEFCIECSFGYFLDADSFEEYGRKGGTCGKYKCLPEQGQLTLSYITQNHIEINQQVCLLSGIHIYFISRMSSQGCMCKIKEKRWCDTVLIYL